MPEPFARCAAIKPEASGTNTAAIRAKINSAAQISSIENPEIRALAAKIERWAVKGILPYMTLRVCC